MPPGIRAVLSLDIKAEDGSPNKLRVSETQNRRTTEHKDSTPKRDHSHLGENVSNIGDVTGNDWNKEPTVMQARIETGDSLRPMANNTLLMEGDVDHLNQLHQNPP